MTSSRLFAVSLLAATALSAATPAEAQRIERIVTFGDSYADDNNALQLGLIPPAFQPLYPTGRFSGGSNYIDTLSQILGVPVDNFAIGGARANPDFLFEVNTFLAGGGGVFPTVTPTFDENDLVTISIGGNDARAYGGTMGVIPVGSSVAGAPAAAAPSIAAATAGLDALVAAGAPTISFLAGDTGRLPEVAPFATQAAIRTAFSTAFNTGMQATLAGYAADGVIVHYLDLNLLLDNVIAAPAAYGITNGLVCPAFPNTTCLISQGDGYLFYGDLLHLTSDGFAIVAQYVAVQLEAPLVLQGASDMSMDVARQFGRTLTTRMDLGSPRDGDTFEGLKFFLVGDGYSRRLDAGQRNEEYRSSGAGLTVGAEYGFGTGVAGIALNYTKPKINFGNDRADNQGRAVQLGGYAGFGLAGGFVQGYAGYGWDKHQVDREGVVVDMDADPKGNHFIAGAKAGYLMPMGSLRVGPVAAFDYAKAKVDSYTEDGDPALTLHVDELSYSSLRGSLGVEVRGDFGGGGVQLRPYASAVVEKDFTGDERTLHFAQTSAPTIVNSFALEDASKKAYGRISGGFSAAILSSVTLDVGGSATIGKDQGEETSAQLGLRIGF